MIKIKYKVNDSYSVEYFVDDIINLVFHINSAYDGIYNIEDNENHESIAIQDTPLAIHTVIDFLNYFLSSDVVVVHGNNQYFRSYNNIPSNLYYNKIYRVIREDSRWVIYV